MLEANPLPLVLDSPFAHLDTDYQISSAKKACETGLQTIYIMSEAQANENVKKTIKNSVGTVYALQGLRVGDQNVEEEKRLKKLSKAKRDKEISDRKKEKGFFEWDEVKVESCLYNKKYEEAKLVKML